MKMKKYIISIILITYLIVRFFILDLYHLANDKMEPILNKGQQFLVLKSFYDIKKDDVIVYKESNKEYVRKVIKIENNNILVVDGKNTMQKIIKENIKGKMIYVFKK